MAEEFVKKISDILVKLKAITQDEANELAHDFKVSPKTRFDYFLLEEGIVEKDDLLRALSEYYQVPYFDAEGYLFNHDLLHLFPEDLLERHAFIPIEIDGNILTVVASDPNSEELLEDIGNYVTFVIEMRVGLRRDIIIAIREFYHKSARELEEEESQKEKGDEEEDTDIVDFIS